MTMQLLNKKQIAEALATSSSVAASILAEHGVKPVDLGPGRSRGHKWLKSEVERVILLLHDNANPKPKERKPRPFAMSTPLASMSASDIYNLTQSNPIQ